MNVVHRLYCRSGRWRSRLDDLLPWATQDVPLAGARVLEIGSGPGRTTDWLLPRVGSLAAGGLIDPVCHMTVRPGALAASVGGQDWLFCSDACLRTFLAAHG